MSADSYTRFPLEVRTVGQLLTRQAAKYGEKPMIESVTGEVASYRELDEQTKQKLAQTSGREDTIRLSDLSDRRVIRRLSFHLTDPGPAGTSQGRRRALLAP